MAEIQSTEHTIRRAIEAAKNLCVAVKRLDFSSEAAWTYNPLEYAWEAHRQYIQFYARPTCRVLFLGMNPGPWGMAQTGVPFGEVGIVRDWLKINGPIGKPSPEHPKRPIEGLACGRSEVSGQRLWGLFRDRFTETSSFFREHFVANYCPLVFMEESARNVTPDKLPARFLESLETVCDTHLRELIEALDVEWIIGVGAFAERCAIRVVGNRRRVARILHPSPASPAANRDWAGTATRQLESIGVW